MPDKSAELQSPPEFDELYSEPSIIGTLPLAPLWSADGQQLAFLWNDGGYRFRDLWLWDEGAAAARQLTDLKAGGAAPDGISQLAKFGDGYALVLGGQLVLVGAEGAAMTPAGTPAGLPEGVRDPLWSEAAGALAFIAGGGLYLLRPGAGAERLVAGAPEARRGVESFRWAEDGRALAFVECDAGPVRQVEIHYDAKGAARHDIHSRAFPGDALFRRRLGWVAASGGAVRWFDRPDPEDAVWGYGLSPDGGQLFLSESGLSIKTHRIWLFDTATGAGTLVYEYTDPLKIRPDWQLDWEPGGKSLLLLTDRDGFNHIYRLTTDGAPPEQLTSGGWEISRFALDGARGDLLFVANRAHPAERHLYAQALSGGPVRALTPAPGLHVPVFSPDFSKIADLYSHDRMPHELFVQGLDEGAAPLQLTRSPRPAFYARSWAETRYPRFASSIDGAPLMARVTLPVGYVEGQSYPVVVGSVYSDALLNQWGGRQAHPCWGLDQYLAARGFMVVSPEIRGSFGHGREWQRPQLNNYGTTDIEDIADAVRHLIGAGMADPARIGIWGSSYGGLMTLMSLFRKAGFYAAGVAGAPATNVFHAYPQQAWIMGLPEGPDYPARYEHQSALWHTDGLKDPLMIIHGTKDEVVLYADTVALVEKLIAQGKDFELVTLPGVAHGWAKDSLEVTRFAYGKLAAFFGRHLRG